MLKACLRIPYCWLASAYCAGSSSMASVLQDCFSKSFFQPRCFNQCSLLLDCFSKVSLSGGCHPASVGGLRPPATREREGRCPPTSPAPFPRELRPLSPRECRLSGWRVGMDCRPCSEPEPLKVIALRFQSCLSSDVRILDVCGFVIFQVLSNVSSSDDICHL